MKKSYLTLCTILCITLSSFSQQVTFDDGTVVNVNHASFDYENIRRASVGPILCLDGYAGSKLATASYLQPEKFWLGANIGFASISLESAVFFIAKEKQKAKRFTLKYEPAGFNTVKAYVLKTPVRKRKEIGLYFAINDYGHLLQEGGTGKADYYSFIKQTKLYLGLAAVNYWHSDLAVDDNTMKRGQFIGRAVLSPFVTFGSVPDSLNEFTTHDVPHYGARIMYELSNTFGLMGFRIKGRTNFILRMGYELAFNRMNAKRGYSIFGFGMVYNFVEKKE